MNPSLASDPTFGYLDCVEDPTIGATGGYLIVSATGRPLEFHCTAPVVASRAQQILFGPTLRPHLLGDQIGGTLVARAAIRPTLLVTPDTDLAAAAREGAACVALPTQTTAELGEAWRRLSPLETPAWTNAEDPAAVLEWLLLLSQSIDIAEPFERIREAIREAQRLGQSQPPEGASMNEEGAPRHDAA